MKKRVKSLLAVVLILSVLGTSITFADNNSTECNTCSISEVTPTGLPGEQDGDVHKHIWRVVSSDECVRNCGWITLDLLECLCGKQKLQGYPHECPNKKSGVF